MQEDKTLEPEHSLIRAKDGTIGLVVGVDPITLADIDKIITHLKEDLADWEKTREEFVSLTTEQTPVEQAQEIATEAQELAQDLAQPQPVAPVAQPVVEQPVPVVVSNESEAQPVAPVAAPIQ